jgi:hypothetical protein
MAYKPNKAVEHMAEEKKETKKEAATAENKAEHTHEHEIPKNVELKKQTPWEHFKQKNGGKNMSKHGFARQNMNRRTGGG